MLSWARRVRSALPSPRWILFETATSIAMVFGSLWQFLLSPGYYVYSDQAWSILPSLPNTEAFTLLTYTHNRLAVPYFFQFTRDIISFPFLVTSNIGISYPDSIKVFIGLSFFLLIVATWIAAEAVVRALQSRFKVQLSPVARETMKFFFVIANFANPVSIQYATDGGQFATLVIMLTIEVAAVLVAAWPGRSAALILGVLLSVGLLLDPDYYAFTVLGIGVVAFFAAFYGRTLLRGPIPTFFKGVAYSLPALAFIVAGIYATATPASLTPYGSITDAIGKSVNLAPWSIAELLTSSSWALVPLGPPSILASSPSLSTLPAIGSPAYMLLPAGPVTYVWLVALAALPLAGYACLAFRRMHSVAVPLCAMTLFATLLSLYAKVAILYDIVQAAASLPVIGFAISISFSEPPHILVLVAATYVVGGTLTLFALLSKREQSETCLPRADSVSVRSGSSRERTAATWATLLRGSGWRGHYLGPLVAIALILLVVFAGWQAFSGSYYPARPDYSTFSGNGVPTGVGAFTPFTISNYTSEAYDFMFSNGSDFNVYWPIGYGVFMTSYSSTFPSVSLPGLPYLLANDLVGDVGPYLASHGVKFVVTQNLTKPVPQFFIPGALRGGNPYLYYFGLPSYASVVSNLSATPGLVLSFSRPGIGVFDVVKMAGLTYNASLLLKAQSEKNLNASVYGALAASGIDATLTGDSAVGVPFTLGVGTDPFAILTPANLTTAYLQTTPSRQLPLNTSIAGVEPSVAYSANSSHLLGSTSWTQSNGKQNNVWVDGFDFTNWAGNFTVTISNGDISVYSEAGTTFTLNYGGPVTRSQKGVEIQDGVGALYSSMDGSFSVSSPSGSGIYSAYVSENSSGGFSSTTRTYHPSSSAPVNVSMSNSISSDTTNFTVRLGGTFGGYLNITYYNLSVRQDPVEADPSLPFGEYLPLSNITLALPSLTGSAIALVNGSGAVNGDEVMSPLLQPVTFSIAGNFTVTGSVGVASVVFARSGTLNSLLGHYVVYNGAFADGVVLVYNGTTTVSPIATTYGMNLYVLPGGGSYQIEFSSSIIGLEIAYIFVIAYLVGLALVAVSVRANRFSREVYRIYRRAITTVGRVVRPRKPPEK